MSLDDTLKSLKEAGWTASFTITDELRQKLKAMRYGEAYGYVGNPTLNMEEEFLRNARKLSEYYNSKLIEEMSIPKERENNPFDIGALTQRNLELKRKEEVYEKMKEQLLTQKPKWYVHGHMHNKKENKMKTKKFYHNFTFKEREITLCLLVEYLGNEAEIKTGYSVRVPEDKNIEGLSKKIALGRAEKGVLLTDSMLGDTEFLTSMSILKGIALHYENQVKKGFITIKGIR